MKKIIIISIVFVIILICVIILIHGIYVKTNPEKYWNLGACEMYEEFLGLYFNGNIEAKYLDEEHHLNKTIEVKGIKIDIGLDISGLYEFIIIGDSLLKKQDENSVAVYRNNEHIRTFSVDFNCK